MAQQGVRFGETNTPMQSWGRLELKEHGGASPPGADAAARVEVDTTALAGVVRPGKGSEERWARVRADVWERALRDANLQPLLLEPAIEQPGPFPERLREIRDRLKTLRALEQRLGEDAEDDITVPRSQLDRMVVLLAALGALTAFAPSELRPFMAAILGIFAARAAWRLYGPRNRVGRHQLADARVALARSVQTLLEHSWVAAYGDRVVEVCPHAVYFACRLTDLDNARGQLDQRMAELRALVARVREANTSLGRSPDDAETARLSRQIDELSARKTQLERVRAECEAAAESHHNQLNRQRAIAARRALSSRVASVVEGADERGGEELANLEVNIVGLSARIRALDVEIGDADRELRSVLEVSSALVAGARTAG